MSCVPTDDITIFAGDDFFDTYQYVDDSGVGIDLTGYTIKMAVKTGQGGTVIIPESAITCTVVAPQTGTNTGKFTVLVPKTQTNTPGNYWYYVTFASTYTSTVFSGQFIISSK